MSRMPTATPYSEEYTMKKITPWILTVALGLLMASQARAAVLVQYTMDNATDRLAPTTEATGVNGSSFTSGSANGGTFGALDGSSVSAANLTSFTGLITTTGSAVLSSGTWSGYVLRRTYGASFADPVTSSNAYIQFTIQPESLTQPLSLDSISLDAAKGGNSNARSFRLAYSVDGFTTSTLLGGADFAAGINGWQFANFSFDLSGITALQNTDKTISFRLYGAGGAANNQMGFDNITVNGEVIPEPGSLALLAAGGLLMLPRRRQARA